MVFFDNILKQIHFYLENNPQLEFLNLVLPSNETLSLTYLEVIREAMVWRNLFDQKKIKPRERVIILLEHSLSLYTSFIGALMSGRVPSFFMPPSPKVSKEDFEHTLQQLLKHSGAKVVVTHESLRPLIEPHGVEMIFTQETRNSGGELTFPDKIYEGMAFIQYSSGTTGLKKGVPITMNNLFCQISSYARALHLNKEDHIVSWLPLYHDMGLITGLLMPLLTATPITAMSPFEWVAAPSKLLTLLSEKNGTLCWLPNFAFAFMAKRIRDEEINGVNLSSVRGVISCAELISFASMDAFINRFEERGLSKNALASCYAMAENTFAVTSSSLGQSIKVDHVDAQILKQENRVVAGECAMVSSGKILPDTQVKIVDDARKNLPERSLGEIAIKSPSLTANYDKNASATSDAFEDDYFFTGDLGYIADNELFVVGRKKDLIIIAGQNIFPDDLEATVNDVKGVIPGRCVAFGLFNEDLGTEELIIIAESTIDDPQEKADVCQLISSKICCQFSVLPKNIELVPNRWLKKSSSGKIARNANKLKYLHEEFSQLAPARKQEPSDLISKIRQCLQTYSYKPLENTHSGILTDGLVDSLALVSFILELEEAFSIQLPSPAQIGYQHFDSIESIAKLIQSIQDKTFKQAAHLSSSAREIKSSGYLSTMKDFDLFVFGSSHCYLLDTKQMKRLNYKAYNFAVESARAEDYYCLLQFIVEHNAAPIKRIVLGLDIQAFVCHHPTDPRLIATKRLSQYLESTQFLPEDSQLDERKHNLLKKQKLLRTMREAAWGDVDDEISPVTGDYNSLRAKNEAYQLDVQHADKDNASYQLIMNQFQELSKERLILFKQFVDLCSENEITLDIFIPPLHKQLRLFLSESTCYEKRLSDLVQIFELTDSFRNISFMDLRDPTVFFGEENNFIDPSHIARRNAHCLVNYILTNREK